VPIPSLVAFDLDDTLYPEREFVRSGFRVVSRFLQEEGVLDRPLWPDLEAAFDAGVREHALDRALEAAGVRPTPALIATLVDVYRTHRLPSGPVQPGIRFYRDVMPALARLRAAGVRLGLITDGPLAAQQTKVRALDVAHSMDVTILTDEWGAEFWKPHPRAFLEMADQLRVEPAACIYVADNPAKDFDGPAAAGWRPSIRIRRPDGLHSDAPMGPGKGPVAAVISGLDELGQALAAAP
jgi:putative hydrolase of the HAD superfamily